MRTSCDAAFAVHLVVVMVVFSSAAAQQSSVKGKRTGSITAATNCHRTIEVLHTKINAGVPYLEIVQTNEQAEQLRATLTDCLLDSYAGLSKMDLAHGGLALNWLAAQNELNLSLPPTSQSDTKFQTPCHTLITKLNRITLSPDFTGPIDSRRSTRTEEQQMKDMEQFADWMEQLDHCVLEAPRELSLLDWQNVASLESRLQGAFTNERDRISMDDSGLQEGYRAILNSCNNDYNQLAKKYNALVNSYNDQRELLIRLSTVPIALPTAPSFVHCSIFNFGSVGSIDCY